MTYEDGWYKVNGFGGSAWGYFIDNVCRLLCSDEFKTALENHPKLKTN